MDIYSPARIKELLGAPPKKHLGQNFLIQKSALLFLVTTAGLKADDTVLEAGPGLGALTQEIAKKVKEVVAVEKDPAMVNILKKTLQNVPNIALVAEDILKWSPQALPNGYKVVANLPYYLSSAFIRRFLETEHKPSSMTLVVQKEVAQRICAKPPRMHLISAAVQIYAEATIVKTIKAGSFWPRPKVDAAVLHLIPYKTTYPKEFLSTFFAVLRAGFLHPRRQLKNNLSEGLSLSKDEVETWLGKNDILPNQRAETLEVKDWIQLAKTFRMEE